MKKITLLKGNCREGIDAIDHTTVALETEDKQVPMGMTLRGTSLQ